MKLTENNFKFVKVNNFDGHEDYWFETDDAADNYFVTEYGQTGLRHVFEVIYSKDENTLAIKLQFDFNAFVVLSEDTELINMFKQMVEKL